MSNHTNEARAQQQERAAHEHATRKAQAYAAKFKTRGVRASAVDGVYLHAYTHFRSEAA